MCSVTDNNYGPNGQGGAKAAVPGVSDAPATAGVTMPVETAAMRFPDTGTAPGAAIKSAAARRIGDKVRASTPTILTTARGVTIEAPTDKKTLLGQ